MTKDDLLALQSETKLSDAKIAGALGITRQTWRNWRTGGPFPLNAQNGVRWLLELRRIDPSNDNLPESLRCRNEPA